MPSLMPAVERSLVPRSPGATAAPVWSARKRLFFVVGSSALLWYAIVRLAVTF